MSFSVLPKFLKPSSAIIFSLCLVGCDRLFGQTTYSVKTVSDGDTITVTDAGGKTIRVRFACVDAPEVPHTPGERKSRKLVDKIQFKWGAKAQQRVRQLVKQGSDRVKLTVTDTDPYGRKVSEVRLPDGTFIQQILAQEGLAQVYKPYLKNCPSAAIVQQAEANAKQRHVGVWGEKKYVSAWEWRHDNK